MIKAKKFLTVLLLAELISAGGASAGENFTLAKFVVDTLSTGTYYVKYRQNPADFAPVTVYCVKDGGVVTYSEKQPQVRYLSRDGNLYVTDSTNKIMEVHEGQAASPMFGSGPYRFAGRGVKTEGEKTLRYEKAAAGDGTALRFFFDGSVFAQLEIVSPGGKSALFFITGFGAGVQDGLFEVPLNYEVRKTLQQLKQEADKGKMPDDPVDKLLTQMTLSEDARLKKGRNFRSELTGGMWHASPVLGSGWSKRLGLLEDTTFIYAAGEMDGETRERFITGEWSVNADGLLTLYCREALRWEGGEVVPATGSTGTKTEIIDAALVRVKYDPAEKVEIRVGDYVYDDSTPRPWKICLPDNGAIWGGAGWWWKYEGDSDLKDLRGDYKRANIEAVP